MTIYYILYFILSLSDEELMDTVVSDRWPEVDFFCFQEVWDRYFTLSLIQELRKSNFNYFCVDVARQSWHINHYFGSKLISDTVDQFPWGVNFQE